MSQLVVEDLRAKVGGREVLRGIDLEVSSGKVHAVMGPNGSGKSTLAHVLMGRPGYEVTSGRVTLDGIDLRTLAPDRIRQIVGYLSEDAYLFDTTIGENLRLAARDASMDDLRAALRSARLLDWVDALPRGLDTLVGEHGLALSGGQRRRLALARALLAGTPVLILDEPTEHLDDDTAAALTRDLLAAAGDRAILLITHRTDDLAAVDEVVTLTAGGVVRTTGARDLALTAAPPTTASG